MGGSSLHRLRKLMHKLILLLLLAAAPAFGQTHTYGALDRDQTWTGKQQMPIKPYTVATLPPTVTPFTVVIVTDSDGTGCTHGGGSTALFCSFISGGWVVLGGASNGILNATTGSGSDLGAKINNLISSNNCGSNSSGCSIAIPPGNYSYSTDIVLPQNTTLSCGNLAGWSTVENPSPTATTLSYTGSGTGITLSGIQAAVVGCTLTVSANAVAGVTLSASNTVLFRSYLIGGGTSTNLVNINCGSSGCEKPELDFVDFYGYTGKAIYCANSNDTSLTNLTGYSVGSQQTSVAFTIDSQCNGLKATRLSFGGSGLHQIVFSDSLSTGAPTWTVLNTAEADCARGGAGILFDSTLGSEVLHARITNGWAAGAGQDCAHYGSAPITISPGIDISGGIGITIDTFEDRSNTGDGILLHGAGVADVTITNGKIWGNNFKYGGLGGDNGDYGGIRVNSMNQSLIITSNYIGNFPGSSDGHQHYGVKITQANPLNTIVANNSFTDNTLVPYIFVANFAYPVVYGNATPNAGPTPFQTMLGDLAVTSFTGGQNVTTHLVPNYGLTTSFHMGLGMNGYFDGTNWHFRSDSTNNGGCLIVGTEQGTGEFDCIGTNGTPASDQTIAPASLSTITVASWDSTGIFRSKAGFGFGATNGFTGTKTAGTCVFTIQGGIITAVSGC